MFKFFETNLYMVRYNLIRRYEKLHRPIGQKQEEHMKKKKDNETTTNVIILSKLSIVFILWVIILLLGIFFGQFIAAPFYEWAWNLPWLELSTMDPRYVIVYYVFYMPIASILGIEALPWAFVLLAEMIITWIIYKLVTKKKTN